MEQKRGNEGWASYLRGHMNDASCILYMYSMMPFLFGGTAFIGVFVRRPPHDRHEFAASEHKGAYLPAGARPSCCITNFPFHGENNTDTIR